MPDPIPPTPEEAAALKTELDALKLNLSTLQGSLAAEKTAREAAETAKTTLEREKMSEGERKDAELKEAREKVGQLDPLRSELTQYETAFKTMYDTELVAVPEEKRAAVEALSKSGKYPERLDALRAAKTLIGVADAGGAMGGNLNPGGGGNANPGGDKKVYTFENAPRLGDITFKK